MKICHNKVPKTTVILAVALLLIWYIFIPDSTNREKHPGVYNNDITSNLGYPISPHVADIIAGLCTSYHRDHFSRPNFNFFYRIREKSRHLCC